MKINNFPIVLLLTCLLLFMPLTKNAEEYSLFPKDKKSVILKVQGTQVKVSTNPANSRVEVNISLMDGANNKLVLKFSGNITDSWTVKLDHRGYYLVEMLSGELTRVTLADQLIPLSTLIITGIMILVVIALRVQQAFSVKIDY